MPEFDNEGDHFIPCEVINLKDGKQVKSERDLDEFPILIRHSQAIPIIRKVLTKKENSLILGYCGNDREQTADLLYPGQGHLVLDQRGQGI